VIEFHAVIEFHTVIEFHAVIEFLHTVIVPFIQLYYYTYLNLRDLIIGIYSSIYSQKDTVYLNIV